MRCSARTARRCRLPTERPRVYGRSRRTCAPPAIANRSPAMPSAIRLRRAAGYPAPQFDDPVVVREFGRHVHHQLGPAEYVDRGRHRRGRVDDQHVAGCPAPRADRRTGGGSSWPVSRRPTSIRTWSRAMPRASEARGRTAAGGTWKSRETGVVLFILVPRSLLGPEVELGAARVVHGKAGVAAVDGGRIGTASAPRMRRDLLVRARSTRRGPRTRSRAGRRAMGLAGRSISTRAAGPTANTAPTSPSPDQPSISGRPITSR